MKYEFEPYLNPVFVETGTAGGAGVVAALKARFPTIHSIELALHYYNMCVDLFRDDKNVNLHYGDSRQVLPRVLRKINKRCTFWLDAHYCGGESIGEGKGIPLMEELKAIRNHHIKDHTILIDDMRLLRDKPEVWGHVPFCICDLEEFIYSINPGYKITYGFGEVENDILIAQI